jgi:hypothetical protein
MVREMTMGSVEIKLYKNEKLCEECGGKCCRIYTDPENGGFYPAGQVWFEEFCDEFHREPDKYGVEPLFDPLVIHQDYNEEGRKELESRGIDYGSCQYLCRGGCMISWEKRPIQCKMFKCEKMSELDEVKS